MDRVFSEMRRVIINLFLVVGTKVLTNFLNITQCTHSSATKIARVNEIEVRRKEGIYTHSIKKRCQRLYVKNTQMLGVKKIIQS